MKPYKIWVPVGALGGGFPDNTIATAISQKVDAIACDAGSTDSGPYYLGTGTPSKTRSAIKNDLQPMMLARDTLSVPLIIGSCGTCGTDSGVDFVRDICLEIARENQLQFKLALVYSEQDKNYLKTKLAEGRISALEGAPQISEAVIDSCSHIVGVMGAEPITEALEHGADIILGGRATDTSLFAAPAMMNGIPPGPAWHGAKTVECGALCTCSMHAGGVIIHFDQNGFEVEAALPGIKSTPYTISAHMLYENTNPFEMREPSGLLSTCKAIYTAINEQKVRVEGSEFEPVPYTIKLEGAGIAGYQSLIMVGIRDQDYIENIEQWQAGLTEYIQDKVKRILNLSPKQYDIHFRRFGLDGVVESRRAQTGSFPDEVEIMVTVTAKTQELATEIVKIANPYVLHMPLSLENELPSFAFPFSPAQIDRGAVFEFKLHHVVEPGSYREMMRITYQTVSANQGETR